LVLAITLVLVFLTETMSNTVAVAAFLPVVTASSLGLGIVLNLMIILLIPALTWVLLFLVCEPGGEVPVPACWTESAPLIPTPNQQSGTSTALA